MFLEIEAGLTVLALVLAFTVPNLGSRWFEAIERSVGKLARRRGLSVIVVGLTALALRAALLPILPIPAPGYSDDYGYLLLSDTFAHGRLTNPTSPMWVHFETFNVIWHPTYTAKYWPAQGLFMAVGQVMLGHPFWGVWLSVGLMCAAITWMLQAWVGEGWALLGGFLAVIRFAGFNYWDNSYWGGAIAAIGGALVLGALPRIKQDRRLRDVLLMGLGFAIVANSRPYEGLFFGIPVAVAMLIWLWKMKRPDLGPALRRVMAPLLAVLALTLMAMGYYFWRVTGNPFSSPYQAYEHAYSPAPIFPWQPLRPIPTYRHSFLRKVYLNYFSVPQYEASQTLSGLLIMEVARGAMFWTFFIGPLLTLPFGIALLTLPYGYSWKKVSPQTRFLLVVCGITIAGEALPTAYAPHYSAPITCAILALVLIAMRRLRSWCWHGRPAGLFVTRAIPATCILLLALLVGSVTTGWPASLSRLHSGSLTWCSLTPSNKERVAMLARLRQYSGGQLVFVRQNKIDSNGFFEWVYNRADLNSAKVVWADDMGPAKNQELIDYYKDRCVWLLYADDQPPKLVPYSEAADGRAQRPAQEGR